MEKYVWSLDVSTTNIGSALWSSDGKLIELKHLKLKTNREIPIPERELHKADIFKNYTITYKEKIKKDLNGVIDLVVIEEPLGGSNNSNTVALLHSFNGICRYILYEVFKKVPIKISVHESRKLFCPELVTKKKVGGEIKETLSFPDAYKKDKKRYIWEKVSKKHPEIEWIYKKNGTLDETSYDMSDAYACGYSVLSVINESI